MSPQSDRPTILRVKRKINESAPSDIVLQYPNVRSRTVEDLSQGLSSINVNSSSSQSPPGSGADRKVYRLVNTVPLGSSTSSKEALQLLHILLSEAPEPRQPIKEGQSSSALAEAPKGVPKQAGYVQTRPQLRHRGLPDAFRQHFNVFDFAPVEEGDDPSSNSASDRLTEKDARIQACMPMVLEYLAKQRAIEQPASTGVADGYEAQMQESVQPASRDEYVCDLYTAVDEDVLMESEKGQAATSTQAPVFQVLFEDPGYLSEEDEEEFSVDSEDSNAEDFYTHDYPEAEGSEGDGSSDEDGSETEEEEERW